MISEAILEPPGSMEVVGRFGFGFSGCGAVEIPLLGSSRSLSQEAKEGELFTTVSVPGLQERAKFLI